MMMMMMIIIIVITVTVMVMIMVVMMMMMMMVVVVVMMMTVMTITMVTAIAITIFGGGGGGYRCYDATPANPSPPQGLQLVLKEPSLRAAAAADGSGSTPAGMGSGSGSGDGGGNPVTDTVVMNNLGYFQLQASPGVRTRLVPGSKTKRELSEWWIGNRANIKSAVFACRFGAQVERSKIFRSAVYILRYCM